jgi:hypothetical protein
MLSFSSKAWVNPFVVIALSGSAFGLAWLLRGQAKPAQAATAEGLAHEVRDLRAELNGLRSAPQRPPIYITTPSAPLDAPVAAAADELGAKPASPVLDPAARQAEAATQLQAKFEQETLDAGWALPMVRSIRGSIASLAPTARLLAADCATSLCRVVLEHQSDEDQRNIAGQVVASEPFKEGVFYDYQHGAGPPKTTLYVIRQGHSFRDP